MGLPFLVIGSGLIKCCWIYPAHRFRGRYGDVSSRNTGVFSSFLKSFISAGMFTESLLYLILPVLTCGTFWDKKTTSPWQHQPFLADHRCLSVGLQPASHSALPGSLCKVWEQRSGSTGVLATELCHSQVCLADTYLGANTDILTLSESPLQLLLNSHRWALATSSSSPVEVMLPEAREAEKEQPLLQDTSGSQ